MNDEDDDGDDEPAEDAGESAEEAEEPTGDRESDPRRDDGEPTAPDAGDGEAADQHTDEPTAPDDSVRARADAEPLADDGDETGSAAGDPLADGADETDATAGDPLADEPSARTGEGDPTEARPDREAEAGRTGAGVAVEDAEEVDPASDAAAEATVDPAEVERAIQAKERERTSDTDGTTAADGAEATSESPDEARGTSDGGAPQRTVSVAVVTVSRERSHDDDPAGEAIEEALADHGHEVVTRELLRPTYDTVQQSLDALVSRGDVDAVVTNGATGVTQDDVTVEALHPIIEKALPGFGEVFRSRYYEAVGTDVVASRATAGIADGTPIFCLPGDPTGVRLGVEEIVAEQAPRIVDAIEDEGPADE